MAGIRGGLNLLLFPGGIFICGLRHNQQAHMRVLRATVFRALPGKTSHAAGLQPDEVYMAGNQIDFAVKTRNPE